MDNKEKYIIISPVRNEEEYIEQTINSVISQTIKPIEWIIVDDGSTDNTGRIIDKYADQYKWIYAIHRHDRGFRKAGGGVIETFYTGYNTIQSKEYDFIIKLDGDLSFNSDYFEKCFKQFVNITDLGIGGGMVYHLINGVETLEKNPVFHVRGATKIYKKDCWEAIAGLLKAPGWDTLDEVKANMLGWKTKSFSELKIIHHRYTGQADGTWRNWVKNGLANYISGYHPLFMISKCLKRILHKPYVIGGAGLLYGFISGRIKKTQQVDDKKLIKYLRQQQLKRLTFRKSIWK